MSQSNVQAIPQKPTGLKVDLGNLFPTVYEVGSKEIVIPAERHQDCMPSNPFYHPHPTVFRKALAWIKAPKPRRPLGLVGETGTGKTELALYLSDKLRIPLYIVKIHGDLSPAELESEKSLVNEGGAVVTHTLEGAAVKAYREGGILLLDEVDKANDSLQAAMHLLLEGKPWPLENGEIIKPHPQCRIIGAANTTGGGTSMRYTSSNKLDQALRSRFGWLRVPFPDEETEHNILRAQFKDKLPAQMRVDMIKTAVAIRQAALGQNMDGKGVDNPIAGVFSTRVLVDWGIYIATFGRNCRFGDAFDFVFGESVDEEDREVVDPVVQRIWANRMDLTTGDILQQYDKAGSAKKR